MSRHRKNGFWQVLADALAPAPAKKPTKQPQRAPQPATAPMSTEQAVRAQASLSWAETALSQIGAANDQESFTVAASTVFSIVHYEPENGYVMTPYLPNLLMNLVDVGSEIGEAHPEAQPVIEGCVSEIMTLLATNYEPPEDIANEMRSTITRISTGEVEPERTVVVRNGSAILDDVEHFLGRFVAYPSASAHVAHTLWIAHTWFMDNWESTPRLAFLSEEPGSGKSRCLEVTEPLVPNAIHAVNTTATYIFRKISDPKAGLPTILFDEIDTVFNSNGGGNETLRGVLNAGYRRGATAGRVVGRGVEELPAYCAVALAGLGHLPDTILTRSVVITLHRRPAHVVVEPWRPREVAPMADMLRQSLQDWSQARKDALAWPRLPEGITDRNADVWEPLIAVADLAGGDWPDKARDAALYMINHRGA